MGRGSGVRLSLCSAAVVSWAFVSGLVDFRVRACRLCDLLLGLSLTGAPALSVWEVKPAGSAALSVARIGPAKPNQSPAAMINAERPLALILMAISPFVSRSVDKRNAGRGHTGAKKGNFNDRGEIAALRVCLG